MYTRDARNNEEVWLLDHIEDFGLDGQSFRSRDYVVAIDDETERRAAFGRIRTHDRGDDALCEVTSLAVLPEWGQSLASERIVDELLSNAAEDGFDTAYAFAPAGMEDHYRRAGFQTLSDADIPARLVERRESKASDLDCNVTDLTPLVREFDPEEVADTSDEEEEEEITEEEIEQLADEMGIDRENQTYKYSTGR